MAVMAVTGIILSLFRITSVSILLETRFGILLLVKVALFLTMAGSALIVILFIGPKLGKKKVTKILKSKGHHTSDELMAFNGTGENAAYIAYKGKIYGKG